MKCTTKYCASCFRYSGAVYNDLCLVLQVASFFFDSATAIVFMNEVRIFGFIGFWLSKVMDMAVQCSVVFIFVDAVY